MFDRLRSLPPAARWGGAVAVALLVLAPAIGPGDLTDYVVRGLPLGSVFALMAVGIVLTYKTSGVLNLAFAAQAFVSAAVFYDLRARNEWPVPMAFLVAVVIIAPAIGLALDRLLFRHLRSSSELARLVTSIGLLVAIPEATKLWFGSGAAFNPPSVVPNADRVYRFGDYALDANQIATIVITFALVGGLSALFRWTLIGLRMRAVVESPRMAQLHGVDADRVSALAWAMSSFLAGLAGVLLAPLFAQVEATQFFTLLVAALAAAVFGRLSSIPLTLLGAMVLGVAMQVLGGELPEGSIITQSLRPALPFVALILLLLFWPGLNRGRSVADPLAGVDPPPIAPAAVDRTRAMTMVTRVFAVAIIAAALVVTLTMLDDFWLNRMTVAVILGISFLSITVITGMGGMISLCQATFAAVGAFATAQLVNGQGFDVLTAVLLGAVIAAGVGALVALPALRLTGIYLALVTLAFAIAFESVLLPQGWVSGGTSLVTVPRPVIGPFDLADDRLYLLLCVAVLALVSVAVMLLRGGTTGLYLDALRGSENAARSIGIGPARSKFVAFSVSAFIAGLGGGLLVTQTGTAGAAAYQANFSFFLGLVWVVLVVTLGARSIQGAIIGGIALIIMPELLAEVGVPTQWAVILFGLGALTYARHPEGIIEANTRRALGLIRGVGKSAAPAGADGDRAEVRAEETP